MSEKNSKETESNYYKELADAGEACSHIAALLYTIWTGVRRNSHHI